MKKVFQLKNLQCAHCANKMQDKIAKLPNVQSAKIAFMTQRLTIEADEQFMAEIVGQSRKIIASIEKNCTIV